MTDIIKKIAKYYKKGYYTLTQLETLCRVGAITRETMEKIIKGA